MRSSWWNKKAWSGVPVWFACAAVVSLLVGATAGGVEPAMSEGPGGPASTGLQPLASHNALAEGLMVGWGDQEMRAALEDGQEIPIDEIPGFPYDGARFLEDQQRSRECDLPCPSLPYTHIRPGAALGVSQMACTANFVFKNGDEWAIGTAGHCTAVGDRHQTLLVNARQAVGFRTFGETIFSTGNAGVGTDFALIRIYEEYHDLVAPGVSMIEGPCGWGSASAGTPMQGYGHGLGWGAGGQVRTGALLSGGGDAFSYALAPGVSWGDSGSPAVFAVTKQAAAVTTHGVAMTPLATGTSLARAFELLDQGGHAGWELVDSPNCL